MPRLLLGSLFGLERSSILTACQGDRSAGVKEEAWFGDRILHQLISERAEPRDRSRYEANSILSWFLREGSDLSAYASMEHHSDHSIGTVFEALLYRATDFQQQVAVASYMAWVNERWELPPVGGRRRPKVRAIGHERAISAHGASAAEGAMALEELESWEEAWAWDNDVGQLSEAELRAVLSEMHTAFTATLLGDVQEELALQAAIAASTAEAEAASAAEAEESIEYVGHEGLQRWAMQASNMQSPSSRFFTQDHIGRLVKISGSDIHIARSGQWSQQGKMQAHCVTWDGPPPNGKVQGFIMRVTESTVQLQGGEAFPNPAKASKNAGRWERFELHRAGMLTAKQRKRRAAATATGVSDTPEHQPSSRTESIAAAAPAVSAAAHSSTLNPLAHAFIPTSTWRDEPPPMSPVRLGDMQEDLALQAALRLSSVV